MKAGWSDFTLKDICVVDWGNTNLTKSSYSDGGQFLAVSAAGCDGRIGHSEHRKHTPVLSAIGAQCGKMFFPEEDFTAIKNTITLTPREALCDGRFLYFLLTFVDLPQRGAGQPFISKGDIQKFPVSIPPLEEQRRIVAVLDEAFAAIATATANAEKNLANAREILLDVTDRELAAEGPGWVDTTMEQICSRFEYGTSAKSQRTGAVPVLRMGNLQVGEIDWSDLVYTDDAEDIRQLSLRPKDVLFNRTNSLEHVGKTAIVRDDAPAIFAGYLIRLHYRPEVVDPEYLNLFLNSRSVRAYGRALAGKSVNQANISAGKLRMYPVKLPTLIDQRRIASKVDTLRNELERLQAVQTAKLDRLSALKQSLLHRAFAGELTAAMPETIAA